MMVYVVLRTGKVLQYNNGGTIAVEGGTIVVRTADAKYLIARLPNDIVERAEFERPCAILRARPKPKLPNY